MCQKKAVVDRLEDGWAVLLIEGQPPLSVPLTALPTAVKEGDCLTLMVICGRLFRVKVDKEATQQAWLRIERKLDILRRQ